ncbi:flagellar protein FlaG [Parahaliea mediterranea]|uniref:Flagellar protein FlaG n=1 Tax=Parahaliea mediterranea TaxID=651086 RepID=A0A939IKV7_9GAMM|nr:flagellar protein FlaG [Parahaliea mediterranea]MBN7795825.1 flagellar protein FlaG [Parahaliea mediterranea]
MTSPLEGAHPARAQSTTPSYATPRQQVEKVLAQLPTGSADQRAVQQAQALGREELQDQARRINSVLRSYGVEFEITGDPPQTVTQIVDLETRDVIRQIPSEEVLAFVERLDELRGLLLNDGA